MRGSLVTRLLPTLAAELEFESRYPTYTSVQNWGAGIRTPIPASKGQCPAIRRLPSFVQKL